MKNLTKWIVGLMMIVMVSGCVSGEVQENVEQSTESDNGEKIEDKKITYESSVVIEDGVVKFKDTEGRELEVSQKVENVISLYVSFSDLWVLSGGELAATAQSSQMPSTLDGLDIIGSSNNPDMEMLLAKKPELVILRSGVSKHVDVSKILEENQIPYLFIDYDNVQQFLTAFEIFCSINDRLDIFEEEKNRLVGGINEMIEKHQDASFTYLQLFSTSKSVSAKYDNSTSEIFNILGGTNIGEEGTIANQETKQFSMEKILEYDPDFILVQTMGDVEEAQSRIEKDIASNPAWNSLSAVKQNRFIYLPKEYFMYKPNLDYLKAFQYGENIIYGEE